MPVIELNGIQVDVDEDGFIQDPDVLERRPGRRRSPRPKMSPELTEDHWKVINYLRDYYQQFGIAPDDPQAVQGHRLPARSTSTSCSPAARPRAPARSPACPSRPAASNAAFAVGNR